MCFSATASFAASGVLTGIGAATLARNGSKPHRMFAAVPLMFAGQQAAEGMVWLTIDGDPNADLHRLAVSAYLGFALVVWPLWLPWALRRIEASPVRRRVLTALFLFGVLISAYAWWFMWRWPPVAQIAGHSIRYDYGARSLTDRHFPFLLAYLVPTVLPFFVATVSLARVIGVTLILSLTASVLAERDVLTSVWCFFAAMLSGLILIAVGREQRATAPAPARVVKSRSAP